MFFSKKVVGAMLAFDYTKTPSAAQQTRLLQEAERWLEAEQHRFEVGLSTSFFVFQAQRDLAAMQAPLKANDEALRLVRDAPDASQNFR